MNELIKNQQAELEPVQEMTIENRLEIIDDYIRRSYLARLKDMPIATIGEIQSLEEDLIDNVRLYKITEMVYQKGEPVTDKFTTVFNTLATYNASVFILIDSDGKETDFYLGVRNNENDDLLKRSTVTLGDTLKNTLIGHFPGVKIQNEDRKKIADISNKIIRQHNVASVSVVGNTKADKGENNENFVQGLEKLVLALNGRQYIGVLIAENQSSEMIQSQRKFYQDLYTNLSPYQKTQLSEGVSNSTSRSKSFTEMDKKQKAVMIGGALTSVAGVVAGAALNKSKVFSEATGGLGAMIGGQLAGQLNTFIGSLAPTEQITSGTSITTSATTENKAVTDMLQWLDDSLKRTNEFDSYGMWNVAGYFVSDDMATAEIAASNYRSLMNGEKSGREVSAINSWRSNDLQIVGDFKDLTTYLSRYVHPRFIYGDGAGVDVLTTAAASISGKELGLHLGLPRATVPGLPVIEHAEFGKEVTTYQLFEKNRTSRPEDRMTLGKVFDLGQITNKVVELDNKSLNMHTFITGSTGSGKSNTVYQMLTELYQDKIPFLVVEPAKGEYKDIFGNWEDVNVYSSNPNIAELINLNPFKFPKSIHVLEHVDGLVEIFSVCWPMYDAMPAFFKDAILKSYEAVGWDLGSSVFEGEEEEYPDFEVLAEQLELLIDSSDYASDIKSNYRGALITRVKSLTVGLNKFIFTTEQTPYEKLFDENCILDISRIKSSETKALIMGLMVYILNEYRVDTKTGTNNGLKHVTVLEEAHNLLKNTSSGESDLIGKSVEMLTNTIAEIRTYGEGFIIVDQSPSSVDIAAIKNTNTKIVLRTPEANDRDAVGRSMGLTPDQVNEIAKLPSGVAVVYQNNWVSPVLTMIDKAEVEESSYIPDEKTVIRTMTSARTNIIEMIMQPWLNGNQISENVLRESLKVLEIQRADRKYIASLISDYTLFSGQLIWKEADMKKVRKLVQSVLGVEDRVICTFDNATDLKYFVASRLSKSLRNQIEVICYVLTYPDEGERTMFENVEKKAFNVERIDTFDSGSKLHEQFSCNLHPENRKYYNINNSVEGNFAHWLDLPVEQVHSIRAEAFDIAKQMFSGVESHGNRTLGLKEINSWKINEDYKNQNLKQHAGFAAEVISTAKENLIAKAEGSGITTYRIDDLVNKKNDPYIDKIRMDAEGNIIDRIQTKFVGKDGADCLHKLASKKFDKYFNDGQVDKVEIPQEYFDEIRNSNLISKEISKLEKQLERVTLKGDMETAAKLEMKKERYQKIDKMLERSTVTADEAEYAVKHPQRYTTKLFAKDIVKESQGMGIKEGVAAATLTAAVSAIDNIKKVMNGESSAQEAFIDTSKDTGIAGAVGYGAAFVSTSIEQLMSKSSHSLIRSAGKIGVPAAVISFGIQSFESISDFATGVIDGKELAFDLGENASAIAGSIGGSMLAGAALGSIVPGAGTIVGIGVGLIGGMVGCALASEAYATAVELGTEGAQVLADKAESFARDTIDLVQSNVPEAVEDVKMAFNDFATKVDLSFSV